jgi:hypothetical protein
MKLITIFCLCFLIVSINATDIKSVFRGFDITQCVTGTADLNNVETNMGVMFGQVLPDPNTGTGAPILAVDSVNERFAFVNNQTAQYTLSTGTYTTFLDSTTGVLNCYFDPDNTYAYEVYTHANLIAVNIDNDGFASYFGRARDVGSCSSSSAFWVQTDPQGNIRRFYVSQGNPTPVADTLDLSTATSWMNYFMDCPVTQEFFDQLFQLPVECQAIDLPKWCDSYKFN